MILVNRDQYKEENPMIQSLARGIEILSILERMESAGVTEIAEELGITINTIRTQVSRGYKKLREILAEEMDTSILIYMFLKNK